MGDFKDRAVEFFSNHRKWVFAGIGAVVVAFLLWAVLSEDTGDSKEKSGSREELEVSLDKAKELQDTFSELERVQVAPSNRLVAYDISLYTKKPFLEEPEMEQAIHDYVELLKYQTNDDRTDTYLLGVTIKVYDREVTYQEDLEPLGTFTYQLREEDKKRKKKDDKYLENVDMRWEYTITQKKEPDYSKYYIRSTYQAMTQVLGVTPLSDEEFDFYLKLNKYSALTGGNLPGGIKLYLNWDLGKDTTKDGLLRVMDEFEKFAKRVTDLQGIQQYYTDETELKEKLAVENPRFLVYALTKEIIDDKVQAKRRLIKLDSQFYLRVYLEDAKEKLAEGESDTSSQEAVDLGELSDEEVTDIQENPGTLGDIDEESEPVNAEGDELDEEGDGDVWRDVTDSPEDLELNEQDGDEDYELGEPMHRWDE